MNGNPQPAALAKIASGSAKHELVTRTTRRSPPALSAAQSPWLVAGHPTPHATQQKFVASVRHAWGAVALNARNSREEGPFDRSSPASVAMRPANDRGSVSVSISVHLSKSRDSDDYLLTISLSPLASSGELLEGIMSNPKDIGHCLRKFLGEADVAASAVVLATVAPEAPALL